MNRVLILIIGAVIALVLSWGICRAISGDVSVSVIVAEQFPKISGNIVIKNQFAKTVAIIAANPYGLKSQPGQTENYYSQWDKRNDWGLGLGWYSADLALNYGTAETFNARLNFFIFPWKVALFTLIFLLAVYILNNIFWHTQSQATSRLRFKPHH